jgi:hypothetical protein
MKSNKLLSSSSLTRTTLVLPLLIVATILVAGPLAMAQQITPPLTAEEQDDQNKIQDTTNVITQFLNQGQKQIGDTIFTPRWSGVTWVEPDRLGVLFAQCLPGEFAVSGQMILGSTDLAVRESYSVALPDDLMIWVVIVENQNSDDRIPGAAGVICASDEGIAAQNTQTSFTLSQDFHQRINNIIQQFTIENINIANVIQNTIITQINNAINSTNVTQSNTAIVNQNANVSAFAGDLGEDDEDETAEVPPTGGGTNTTTGGGGSTTGGSDTTGGGGSTTGGSDTTGGGGSTTGGSDTTGGGGSTTGGSGGTSGSGTTPEGDGGEGDDDGAT